MNEKQPVGRRRRLPTGWVVLLAFLAAVVGLAALLEIFAYLSTGDWWAWNSKTPLDKDVPRNATAAGAGIAVAIAGAVAYTRQRTAEDNHTLEQKKGDREEANLTLERAKDDRAQVEALRSRYTTAATQLGDHVSSAIRLAGVYAMAALVDDWMTRGNRSEAQTCINVLCAYLRSGHSTGGAEDQALKTGWRGELEVRQSIVAVITSHLQPGAEQTWEGMDFDFTGTNFDTGSYSFMGARFSGSTVSFEGAGFSGGEVFFEGAEFSGGAVSFYSAKFSGGTVSFLRGGFSGSTVSFYSAGFSGGEVFFIDARFSGGTVSFDRARFSGGDVSFGTAEFSGSALYFGGAEFSGGDVSFYSAKFSGGGVSFEGAEFSGGEVFFVDAKFVPRPPWSFERINFNLCSLSPAANVIGPWGVGLPKDGWSWRGGAGDAEDAGEV